MMKKLYISYQVINLCPIPKIILQKMAKEVHLGLIVFFLMLPTYLILEIQNMTQTGTLFFQIIGILKRPVFLKGKISADEVDLEKFKKIFDFDLN